MGRIHRKIVETRIVVVALPHIVFARGSKDKKRRNRGQSSSEISVEFTKPPIDSFLGRYIFFVQKPSKAFAI